MQSEPCRHIHSVSDLLYSTDEIEFLLVEDIKDLEPKSYKPEEIQVDFDGRQEFSHVFSFFVVNLFDAWQLV